MCSLQLFTKASLVIKSMVTFIRMKNERGIKIVLVLDQNTFSVPWHRFYNNYTGGMGCQKRYRG